MNNVPKHELPKTFTHISSYIELNKNNQLN